LNFGQTIQDKTQVLLGTTSGAHLGTVWELDARTLRTGKPFGDMIGTHWEQGGKKIPLPLPPQKEKNCNIHECVLICVLFFFLVQFLPLPLAQAKYGDQQFRNQKYMWPMGRLQHAFKVPGFFFF
jgi:hypothetical protein